MKKAKMLQQAQNDFKCVSLRDQDKRVRVEMGKPDLQRTEKGFGVSWEPTPRHPQSRPRAPGRTERLQPRATACF